MPTKVKKTSSKKSPIVEDNSFLSRIKWDDSYVSLVVGLLVVVVIAVLGVVFFKGNRTIQQDTSSAQFKPSIEFNQTEEKKEAMEEDAAMQEEAKAPIAEAKIEAGSTYTVKAGDTLWSISEKTYKSGYNWVDIAKTNNISNPGTIFAGTKLSIPQIKAKDTAVVVKPDTQMQAKSISGNSYTIQKR